MTLVTTTMKIKQKWVIIVKYGLDSIVVVLQLLYYIIILAYISTNELYTSMLLSLELSFQFRLLQL